MNAPTIPYLIAVFNETKRRRDHIVDVELRDEYRATGSDESPGRHALLRDANMLWQVLEVLGSLLWDEDGYPLFSGMPHMDRLVGS